MTNIETVRKDLKSLKQKTHLIENLRKTQMTHIMRIEMLKKMTKTTEVCECIEREERLLSLLKAEPYIKEAELLEEKYMSAINLLDPIDKIIILDAFVNGTPYWRVGVSVGYSEEGVRKRVSKIIHRLACSC